MTRARVLGALLALILLACGAVIYLDQRGAFGGGAVSQGTTPSTSTGTEPTPGDPGYGDLR